VVEESRQPRFVAGVSHEDMIRLGRVLAGACYPAEKWQLIDHAVAAVSASEDTDRRLIHQLWALPPGRYHDFTDVLAGAARTARGHPRRGAARPGSDRQARPRESGVRYSG
jgi:Protein of unknown function (DUF2795)